MNVNHCRLACAGLIFLSGCGLFGKKRPDPVVRPVSHETSPLSAADGRPKLLAIANGNTGRPQLDDPSSQIPPPPDLGVPPIPEAPPKDTALVSAPKLTDAASGLVLPAGGRLPTEDSSALIRPAANVAPATATETPLQAVKRLQKQAVETLTKMEGFEAKLTRRETIAGKPAPEQEMLFKYRTQPMSVHMKWVGLEARGRELVYVAGRKGDTVEILTARGDGFALTPAGKRVSFAPTDAAVRGQSRYDIREGGMMLALTSLGQAITQAERDPAAGARLRFLGRVPTLERQSGWDGVEQTIPPGGEPQFPKGGKRTLYFDPEPSSPSYGLPVLMVAFCENREVEYYHFANLKPARLADADFDANKLWKK